MRDYLWPVLGSTLLADLRASDMRRLNAKLEKRRVRLLTRRRTLEDLRCALRHVFEEAAALERSPWVSAKKGLLPKLPESAPNPLNDIELAEAVKVAPENWKPVIPMLAYTGVRWGELQALRWKDIRESPYPHRVICKSREGPTKNRKVREVPLLPEAQEVLNALGRRAGAVFALPETAS